MTGLFLLSVLLLMTTPTLIMTLRTSARMLMTTTKADAPIARAEITETKMDTKTVSTEIALFTEGILKKPRGQQEPAAAE